jgi:hypothetical protein
MLVLAREPEAGPGIAGTGGFRKLRWPDSRRGEGMTIYDKDEAADLTAAEKRALRAAIEQEIRQRATHRRPRRWKD